MGKKLIEVALPLPEINDASAYDKRPGIGPHPKGIHKWWAPLPLPVARAVLFASVVDDPSSHPERFPTEEAQAAGRERLFGIIRRMMQKQLHKHPEVYAEARAEMLKHCDGRLPPVLDPFAGGGSIPLEAARLGLEAYAGEINPVCVLLNKCNLEIVPRWADRPPVNPEWRNSLLLLGAPASSRHNPQRAKSQAAGTAAIPPAEHRGWTSRGYLPHFDAPRVVQSITFRLADAVPEHVIAAWREELRLSRDEPASDPRMVELLRRIERYEDAGHGSCSLRDPRIAELVQHALLHFDGVRYRLLAWCIMPNHVHLLIEPFDGFPLAEIVHSWKSFTAKEANKILGREGTFWQREYFDRFIRDETHLQAAISYIENNPVKAGLVSRPEDWPFSSAKCRTNEGAAVPAASSSWQDTGPPSVSVDAPQYRGASGLAADVRYYGRLILERARARIGHLYLPAKVTAEMAAEHPHLKPYVGRELPVIAWIWARTVPSPNPAARGAHVPLMSTFWLSSKKGSEAWLQPVVDRAAGTWRFRVRTGPPPDRAAVKAGTKLAGSGFRCLLTGDLVAFDHVREQASQGQMGAALVAVVAEGPRGKLYLPATREHVSAAESAKPSGFPKTHVPGDALGFRIQNYGITKHWQMFTPRQLTAMVTLSDLVREVREDVRRDAGSAGVPPAEAEEYVRAVSTFLALALDRCVDASNSLCRWDHTDKGLRVKGLFARQAIPMVWDFAEANVLGNKSVCWQSEVRVVSEAVEAISASAPGHARAIDAAGSAAFQRSAAFQAPTEAGKMPALPPTEAGKNAALPVLVSTDPPYYDNIGYAALSDFFYVWLRRTIGDLYPDLFATILVPKDPELVAAPERFGGDKRKAKEHFEQGFRRAFAMLREKMDPRFPLTVYYAFKQDDEESGEDEEASGGNERRERVDRTTGWETMLTALIETGFQITATWPVRASQKWRMRAMGSNALASYIVLACRPRPEDAPQTDRRGFVAELKRELPGALRKLQQGNIAPVDFAQAAIGPGMAIFSKYRRLLEASGRPMSVRTALALINQVLTEVLSEQDDEFDNDTRWAVAWFEQHGFEAGEFGEAELLSKAKVTSVNGLVQAGIVHSGAGKVRLLRPAELRRDWDPGTDARFTLWEATHHLLRLYYHEQAGDRATAELLRKLGSRAEMARDLAYRLFSLSEKKNRSQDAQAYNALVLGWPELARISREQPAITSPLFEGG